MKKIFEFIGLIALITFGFIYTEKAVMVVKEYDEIMIKIKAEKDKYKIDYKPGIINNNTIIPGIKGTEVDIDKSYSRMKKYGQYNEILLVYKTIKPNILIKDNIDKYIIGGNENKNMVSLIFLVDKQDNINNIINVLQEQKVEANFFIDSKWLKNNNNILLKLIEKEYVIGNLSNNGNYLNDDFIWVNTVLNSIRKQQVNYCYQEQKNDDYLKQCSKNDNYTIIPSAVINNNPFIEIKKELKPGSIISLKINKELEAELKLIIDYIHSRGLKIKNLINHLEE